MSRRPASHPIRTRLYDGQHFVAVGTELYTRDDGHVATLQIWETQCVVCSRPFQFKRSTALRRFEPNRRCELHKRPGHRVNLAGGTTAATHGPGEPSGVFC